MNYHYYHNPHFVDRRQSTYAVVIYLPQKLNSIIHPLRERFDPEYNLVDAHISLVFPFDTERPLDEIAGILKHELDAFKPFEIRTGTIGDFYPEAPVIYWEVKKCKTLKSLYQNLNNQLGLKTRADFQPHVTVAREISDYRIMFVKDTIASYLSDDSIYVEQIDLIAPLSDRKWVSVRTFKLKE